ncbi:MAG TPA: type II toxin-antitoxin system prevent-host-death family antitoxin [Trueperaceae bacterium]|jgi:prevent-host-death family protein|nr:type II toxin-antitoxin system prevent-host-death family antitoxin [Trueperaceae bacterium]
MAKVGIRELRQNASTVVAKATKGETVTITDRGRPVAEMRPVSTSILDRLVESGHARPPRRDIRKLPAPEPGPNLSAALAAMRDAERY